MHVLSRELGELDLPVGVTIRYLSLKGFFSPPRPKVSHFRLERSAAVAREIAFLFRGFKRINMLAKKKTTFMGLTVC